MTADMMRYGTLKGLRAVGVILVCVLLVAIVVAIVSARSLTRPVQLLAQAAKKHSGGDFKSRVEIRTRDEMQELGDIFNDMGPKLDEHQKMKQSLALAMVIQQNLLPREPPQLEGFNIAGKSVPCDETGGDYYDFIELVGLGANKLGIALGDVTGHGISAALLMASARSALRNQLPYQGESLEGLFERLNDQLVRDTGEERFMTLFYGLLDAEARTLQWASGGHDPALLLRRKTGEIEELAEPRGIPLGIMAGASYQQSAPVTLDPGDIVLVGTDGIWEAASPAGDDFGKDRLKEILTSYADTSAAEICDRVVVAVSEFRDSAPQADDITLVVIRATGA
jgi:sigma-B regulation protein RsbU (phosphoserine phosphatase)